MKRVIDKEIASVVNVVGDLWDLVITAYNEALEAFTNKDSKKALSIIKNDSQINSMEEDVNDLAIKIITLHAPVASDLRFLIASIKIANQLERIADYTVNVADSVLLDKTSKISVIDEEIQLMLKELLHMIEIAKVAFVEQDVELAKSIMHLDLTIDELYNLALQKLMQEAQLEQSLDPINMRLTLIAKYMERSGDHIMNIGEIVYYMVKGRQYVHVSKND